MQKPTYSKRRKVCYYKIDISVLNVFRLILAGKGYKKLCNKPHFIIFVISYNYFFQIIELKKLSERINKN